MTSWILTASYLWKDTWKRWFEQPGSVLARSVVTIVMVSLSVLLLVGFRMQIESVRKEMEAFGLDNLIVRETVTSQDIAAGVTTNRFQSLRQWGDLFTGRMLQVNAAGSNGRPAAMFSYSDEDMQGLLPYLKYGHEIFVLSATMPPGLVVDYEVLGVNFRAVSLQPTEQIRHILTADTVFVPRQRVAELEDKGYSMIYFLRRDKDAPSIASLSEAVNRVARSDRSGSVDIRNAELLRQRLEKLEEQQATLRITLAFILGGALALVYGVLSILEFRQSMYVSALLKSFGVSSVMLGIRTVFENAIIVNCVTAGVVYAMAGAHDRIFGTLRISSLSNSQDLYWGMETLWIFSAANVGILLSCIPVFLALRRPVGSILE